MCKTTKGNQSAASPDTVRTARRTPGGGPGGPPPEPANAFRGKSERVPEVAFIRERAGDGFLTSAKTYYELFGIDVAPVDSIEQVVLEIANYTAPPYNRLLLVSHAHPRGMLIPFFTNGVKGTNKEIFREFAKSDLDGLKLLSPFEPSIRHLFNWNSIVSQLMGKLREVNAAALQPFGLQSSGNPTGDLLEFMKFAFDIVYLRNPGRVRRNTSQAGGLTAGQRTILENFVGEIMNQMRPGLVSSLSVTTGQVNALRSAITGLTYNDLPGVTDAHPDHGRTDKNRNDFPTLQAVVNAINNGFRTKLNAARTKLNASTLIDIRGCRAGDDADYIEAIREFFGTGAVKPMVTAPRHFQSYPKIAFQPPATRAHIASWLSGSNWGHSSSQMKQKFTDWAELIRVRPLHYDFWLALFRGQATRFDALAWRSEIPALFIPTPGLAQLTGLDLAGVIGKLKDYFNVPNAQVPSAAALSGPNRLTAIKTFMTAAGDSLETGDGLHYYMLFAGLPVFVHGTPDPELNKNGLVVLDAHRGPALQSWYKCLWKDPLPASGPYTTASIGNLDHRQVTALVNQLRDENNNVIETIGLAICPVPRYSHCIRKRPMPPDEDDSLC